MTEHPEIAENDVEWITPRMAIEIAKPVLVHSLWTPDHPAAADWFGPPPEPPRDQQFGYWAPVPRMFLGVSDFHYANCCRFVIGTLNLFQEDEKFCVITAFDTEWRIPWDLDRILAKLTPEHEALLSAEQAD